MMSPGSRFTKSMAYHIENVIIALSCFIGPKEHSNFESINHCKPCLVPTVGYISQAIQSTTANPANPGFAVV
jgi:hypothetical protein